MSNDKLVTRREFTVETALAMLAGVTITITGCGNGDDDGGPGPGPSGQPGGSVGAVSSNAGHTHGGAEITAAQLAAGNAIVLTLTGSGHTHTVGLSQAELAQISAGTRVQKESSNDQAHTHFVTFN